MNAHSTSPNSLYPAMPVVSGSTAVYFIIGDPVEQVRAPETFNAVFARHGIDAVLVPIRIASEHLLRFVQTAFLAPNVQGLWITIPHKIPLMALLADASPAAVAAGAVNAVRRNADGSLSGALFDGQGFVAGLDYAGIAYAGQRVLVLGAGGAAAAIGTALVSGPRPCAALGFFDPVEGRAAALVAHMQRNAQATAESSAQDNTQRASMTQLRVAASNDPAGFDLVINATPLGLHEADPLPCDIARMDAHAAFADILMKNQPTPAVRAALARGLQAQPGFEMMVQQTHSYLAFFGHHAAAQVVQSEYDSLRQQIYPASLLGVSTCSPVARRARAA